jgi:competence protein ComGC
MDPNEFLFLILPLTVLVVLLVVIVYRLAVTNESVRTKEMETLNELMQMGALDKDNYSETLQGLVSDKVIDKGSFERLGKLIEESFEEEECCSQPENK